MGQTRRFIYVFCDEKKRTPFGAAERSRAISIEYAPVSDQQQVLKKLAESEYSGDESPLCYLDIADEKSLAEAKRIVKKYADAAGISFGILDTRGVVSDPSEFFHIGAVDYLGPGLCKSEIDAKRFRAAFEFAEQTSRSPDTPSRSDTRTAARGADTASNARFEGDAPYLRSDVPISKSWNNISDGQEYTFIFLYIQLDLVDEWKNKSGKDHLDKVTAAFQNHVTHFTGKHDGRVWMWTEQGGLVLFPFDGTSCPPIETCLKLVLDRTIISAEYYTYNTLISYRMALHIGPTAYRKRGKTGTLVSDTVNFIYHLGQKALNPGNLLLTEPVYRMVKPGLTDCFVPNGKFEGYDIHRMRLPVT